MDQLDGDQIMEEVTQLRHALVRTRQNIRFYNQEGVPFSTADHSSGIHEDDEWVDTPDTMQSSTGWFTEEHEEQQGLAEPGVHAALIEPVSARELEVLQLVATGASNKDISRELVIEVATVKRHLGNIFRKLAARSRTQAVARARSFHLLRDDMFVGKVDARAPHYFAHVRSAG